MKPSKQLKLGTAKGTGEGKQIFDEPGPNGRLRPGQPAARRPNRARQP